MDSLPKEPQFSPVDQVASLYMRGKKVVMVSHPGCHYCQLAFKNFTPEIRDYFKSNAIFITPLSEEYFAAHAPVVFKWNDESEFKHIIVHLDARLPQISDLKGTPQFYFMNNGVVIEKLTGWRPGTETLVEDAIHHLKKL